MSSSRPSAFDALMSNARAAAKKKTPQTTNLSRSPNKRKIGETQDANLGKTIVSEGTLPKTEDLLEPVSDSANPRSDTSSIAEDSKTGAKKAKTLSKTDEMKSKIGLLKKKPNDFDPEKMSCWEKGERVPFLFVALAFDLISNESGRIVITDILCNMLRTVIATTPEDLVATVYLSANEIAPAHEGVELGIGESTIIKAISEAFGRTEDHVKKQNTELGDLGLVAKGSRSTQTMMFKPEPLTVVKVFDTFRQIAKESGKDSNEKKKNRMKALLVATTDCEPLYLTRLLQAKLRLGFSGQTVLAALGQAAVYNEEHSKPPPNTKSPLEEAAKIVKQVFTVLPVYDIIVPALLSGGVWNLPKTCNFTLGVPIGPMLAKPTKGVAEILNKFQDIVFTCEYKYDGERAQIHFMEDGTFEIYSRNAERNTGKYPDVALALSRLKKPSVKSFILDCEVVAFDREKKKILPFQILSTRARKNVNVNDIKVGVCIFAFDMLYLNGQQLIQENLKIRREQKLYESFEEDPGYFQFATAVTSNDIDEIQKFLDASVDVGIGDSVDLVPIAAFHGRGKRTGVYGAFLLACYDVDKEEFQSICKIGTGFSDAMLDERSSSLRSQVIATPKQYYRVGDSLNPDVWFEPTEVWEVKAADLTISPVHRAATGIVDPDKGISLRFPRLLRVREDKKPEEATSSEQIADLYQAQKHNHPSNEVKEMWNMFTVETGYLRQDTVTTSLAYEFNSCQQKTSLWLNSPSTCTVTIEVLGHELDFAQDPNSKHLGTTVWDASMVFAKYLGKNSRKGRFSSSKLKGKRAIELGAGCGVAGFALAMLGCDVVTTDQKEVLPLLKRNVEWNTSRIVQMNPGSAFGSLRVAELDWGNEDHITAVEPPFDYVIGTDVVYSEQLLEPLLRTILALSGPKTTVMLGYEIRSTVVHEKMLQMWKDNFEVKTIPRSKMDGEYQDPSIHLYIMAQKSPAESSGNVSRDEVVIDTDETKCETKVPTGECHKRVEEEAVVTHGPRLNEDSLLMRLRDGKLSEWEMRRYGTVAAQLLRDVKIDVQVKK
ncbi:unnamed protein product [Arabidopsis thaliana]|uniref:DNA ligase n=1 Tax=Arabidopsis thaliana TaxID=3702 RepID=A0A654ECZ4_ARATH|nr:unnamed protein product [Arabidopsis thaliana]